MDGFTLKKLRKFARELLPSRALHTYRMIRHTSVLPYEREIELVPKFLDRRKTAIDIGANVGIYTTILSRLSARVIAFEPNPSCARYLNAIDLPNCVIDDSALSDKSGSAILYVPLMGDSEIDALGTLNTPEADGAMAKFIVNTATLDQTLASLVRPAESIGFIKIDVEGHELAVLRGAQETLQKFRPALMIEIEFRHQPNVEQTFAILEQQGYRAWAAVESPSLSPITVPMLRALQTEEKLRRKIESPRYFGYVNNVFFLPANSGPITLSMNIRST